MPFVHRITSHRMRIPSHLIPSHPILRRQGAGTVQAASRRGTTLVQGNPHHLAMALESRLMR
jgi:hypothetical protein